MQLGLHGMTSQYQKSIVQRLHRMSFNKMLVWTRRRFCCRRSRLHLEYKNG